MSREKQTEIPESEMGMSGYSKFSWKLWEAGICNMSEAQRADQIMREQGYRKASEVAREILDIIERRLETNTYHSQGQQTSFWIGLYKGKKLAYNDIKEIIEQKYTEDK